MDQITKSIEKDLHQKKLIIADRIQQIQENSQLHQNYLDCLLNDLNNLVQEPSFKRLVQNTNRLQIHFEQIDQLDQQLTRIIDSLKASKQK